MPKLYRLSGREAIYFLPLHPELAVGTLRGILKQAGITVEDFLKAVEGS